MSKALATKNVAAVLVALAIVFGFAFAFALPAKADTLSDLQAQVQALLAQIAALQGSASGSGAGCSTFTRNHSFGNSGGEVMAIQRFLNAHGSLVASSGAGSPGNETSFFGARTRAAVSVFQSQNGITPTAGFWGPITRARANAICAANPNPTPTPTPTPTGPGITVSATAQPANSLAPKGAARVPFTNFNLTNNSDAVVTVNGITVQRVGLAQDAAFSGIVLIDTANGVQVGTSKTLNSNHQAVVGDTFTLQPGETKTLQIAGNMAASLTSYTGQVAGLSVVGINTSVTVSGSLPITGASQTLNDTLSIGTVSTSTSAFDPGAAQTKNIGDTNVRFSGLRFTAGSTEDLKLFSIRWRQVGTAAGVDISNVVTNVNGTVYPTTLSADGKYFTAVFPGGILIGKGNSIDVYVQGNLSGTNSASRTVDFDIDKVTDIYFVGQLYGYGIAPSGTYTPWYNGYVTTINAGTATTISKANEVAAQNIAVNVSNQPLGGFATDFKGEAVSVQSMVFSIATTTGTVGLLTSVSIVDSNGVVVAGPVDAAWSSGTSKLTFTDTVTFPTGRHVYTLKGKVPSSAADGATIAISSTPSSQWTTVTGQVSGNSISLSGNGAFTMNTMTVRAASLAITVSATPASTTIVAGGQGVLFANIQFDTAQSGEDVRFTTFVLDSDTDNGPFAGSLANLSGCQAFDGATALNGGSNIVNPSTTATTTSGVDISFTLDNSLTVPKGTVKTLAIKCNASSSADSNSTFQLGMGSTNIAAVAATGVTSGVSITPTGSGASGQVMTISGSGTVAVSTDSSSPSYAVASANSTGVTLGVYKFRATNESVNLQRIGLSLTNTASSSASDLTQVTLWSGGVQIGSAIFTGTNTKATSTLSSTLLLPRDTDVMVTVKGDLSAQGTSAPGTPGHLVAVDIENNTNTRGTGAQSGSTVNATGSTAVSGVRIFKSYPVFVKDTVPTNTLNNGQQALLRFKVTANSQGDVGISKFTFTLATTTASVTGVNIYAFTDSAYSTPVSGISSDGGLASSTVLASGNTVWVSSATQIDISAQTTTGASTTVEIPAGQTRFFEVRGTVAGAATGASISTALQGDAAYPSLSGFTANFSSINGDTNNDFIWSPNSTTTSVTADADWTNGFGLVGLPSSNMSAEVLSK